jgi:hypothetical protein
MDYDDLRWSRMRGQLCTAGQKAAMTIAWRFAIAAALLLPLSVVAWAQDELLKDVRSLPPHLHSVHSGGYWEHGNQDGFYRIVVMAGGFEHVIARLYVQWVSTDQGTRDYKIIRTVNVTEFNGGGASVIQPALRFTPGAKNLQVALAVTWRDGKTEKRALTVMPDGRYTLK